MNRQSYAVPGLVSRVPAVATRPRRRSGKQRSQGAATPAGCLIIGISASAATLEAVETFFDHLPANSGMAFVLVLHRDDSQHQGLLEALRGRYAAMAVVEAREGMSVAPNRVFINPPNATLTVRDSVLHVSDRVQIRKHRGLIDAFFVSLAEGQGERGVGVVLSGASGDGKLGMRKIREHGGLILAQLECDTTVVGGSSQSVDTGLVDHLAAVAEMPRLLIEYQHRIFAGREAAAPLPLIGAGIGAVECETDIARTSRNVQALEQELHTTKLQLRTTIDSLAVSNEELQALNEEYQSVNEELRAANAELEASREEMQSVNEDLRTTNVEMSSKNELLTRLNDNLKNLLDETQIATIFLESKLNITYFTPAMTDLFQLRDSDRGRPITELATRLRYTDLHRDVAEVTRTLGIIEREVRSDTEAVFLMRIRPYRSMQDLIDGVVITFIDISDRKRHEAALARLAAIVDSSQDAIIGHTLDGTITSWNAGAQSIFGYSAAEAIGKPFAILIPEDQDDQAQAVRDRLRQGVRVEHFEVDRVRKDGQTIDVSLSVSPVKDADGELIAASTIAREFTQRKLLEDHKSMLMRELDHRMQNTLAVVSSLVRQTVRSSNSLEAFAEDIEGRLQAFSRVQSLSHYQRQGGVALRDIVLGELHPYELQQQHRIVIDTGNDIVLTQTATQALAMALHELATNAAKYGALSVPAGKVEVTWRVENLAREQRVLIDWIERDGPPVRPPERRGFGTQLIEKMLGFSLNAKVQRDFRPEGVRCRIELPLVEGSEQRGKQHEIIQ